MTWILVLALLVALGFLVSIGIRSWLGYRYLREKMQDSLIVFGKRGHGKTLLFSVMARMSRKSGYLSTGPLCQEGEILVDIARDLSVSPNTYRSFIRGELTEIPRIEEFEGRPVFIDDAGIYLPNYADAELKKAFPSLPIAYAIWRHLYNAPWFINSQAVGRTYRLIKEQADGMIKARRVRWIGPIGILRLTYFSNIQSADLDLSPFPKPPLFRGRGDWKARRAEYEATHGEIRDFLLLVRSRSHRYDSRYFRSLLQPEQEPSAFEDAEPVVEKNSPAETSAGSGDSPGYNGSGDADPNPPSSLLSPASPDAMDPGERPGQVTPDRHEEERSDDCNSSGDLRGS